MKYTATDGHIPFVAGFIPHSVFVPQFQFHLIFPRSVCFFGFMMLHAHFLGKRKHHGLAKLMCQNQVSAA